MNYNVTNATSLKEARWNEKTCIRMTAGFSLDKTNLPAGMEFLPKGAPLAIVENKAVLVKTAVVNANADANATSLRVEKGHCLIVGDKLAGKTISAINTSNASYDTLTIGALASSLTKGDVVADDNASAVVGLNYASVKIDTYPSCTPTIQAYEIESATMPYPVNSTIKTALTSRHMFI